MMLKQHLLYGAIFALSIIFASVSWDIDHLFASKECKDASLKILKTDVMTGTTKGLNCRGIFHSLTFALIMAGVSLGYFLHLICDFLLK